ncbi:MAG TPA: D-2-hydroxyacid dehydrogenase [Candidatus Acidoferrales bacterium]|nr:D-2-hydroxyacid dehydrogenase [Candidatus Acidoferrales bacterium]
MIPMQRTKPEETSLTISAWHRFTLWRAPAEFSDAIRRRWPQMRVTHLPDYSHLDAALPDADILVGFSIRPDQFALARRLKWIHATAAGVGQLMFPELRRGGIVVTNARGIHSAPMAEHILGTIIALARRFPDSLRYQMQSRWAQQELWDAPAASRMRELQGQILLIVGFGSIGRELARRIQPLGMRVWGVTRFGAGDASLAERILPVTELRSALPQADFVLLAAPETPETRRMIGEPELARMKPSAYLINVARGSIIDEPALIEALRRRAIAGAALDVAEKEPLPPESPMWKLDNVFITPHVSAVTDRLWERQAELLLENLDRWFRGRELLNQVDLERGY